MTSDIRETRLARRISHLFASDPQFAAAQPNEHIAHAIEASDLTLPRVLHTIFDAYADRPALGQRALEFVTDADTGRTSAQLLSRFDTITYRELSDRVDAVAAALTHNGVQPGDRVAILGFTSIDYTTIDMALLRVGAVSVPLQTSAPVGQLRPVAAETEPVVIASSVDLLDDAVEVMLTGHLPQRLMVFDYHAQLDDHRDALAAARSRLAETDVVVETLVDTLARGRALPTPTPFDFGDDDLALLIYTSGSTGTPKGAMYPAKMVAGSWRRSSMATWGAGEALPSITLNFMPMSHMMGRGILYATLGAGGIGYFVARSDLSTLLDDLALVRPTQLNFVPRVWDMIFQQFQSEVDRQSAAGVGRGAAETEVLADLRQNLLGGRFVSAMTGSAPISAEMTAFVESLLDLHLTDGYGSTEAGAVFVDGQVARPPVIDYKLADVPDLGYFRTDRPYPRGELLIKSETMFPGYYKRPETTAEVFDADGYYRTGDVVAELGPDRLTYLDRRNNVLKLSQGEFVTVSKLEAAFGTSPLVRQIFVYGNSARSYLLAVIVPTEDALARHSDDSLKSAITESLQDVARTAGLQSYEIPRDFIVETTSFTLENGLLTGIRKLARPKLKERYGERLEQLYSQLADTQASELRDLRLHGADRPVIETVSRAAGALLGAAAADVQPDAHFTDLGGDSLSALTFGNLLTEIYDIDVPVGVIVSPANDLTALANYVEAARRGSVRPTFASVHGRDTVEARAGDLTLDKFVDAETLAAAPSLPGPASEVRTVLLTGATGFLGRYLALEWLERMELVDGKVICLVRAKDDASARARLDDTFDSGDPELLRHYRELAVEHLEVVAGDKGEADLGLDRHTWQRLADTVDLIVDPAALVNHVLPYRQLFGPNVVGTAELIRLALTTKIKPFVYVSTIGVGAGVPPGQFTEDGDIRVISATRKVDDNPTTGYANGYSNSKWAGEVLLREAHDLSGLPVSVFRCDMILADTTYAGQLNLPDMFTRLVLSLVATGIAPFSFYEVDGDGNRQRAHYDGLPVEFIAEAISTLGEQVGHAPGAAFETYHVMNPYDDGLGLDEFVDWLIDAGYRIERVGDYATWLHRFDTAIRALPERQRQASLLPLLHNYQRPETPIRGSIAPTERFRTAVQDAKIGPDKDIPHVTRDVIVKYVTDLQLLGLV
ncbi:MULTISPECIES: carboxylic acid reductase [unclassified Mycobacterium]|uniref:carboxylic acid reductase n=1 Tax=unclassified Mycobacterium TaxID=2642494 RepID=UPI0007401D01|nr:MULTISPECIES: carboxylic acid reductase [unclassified Mycobacterium]KUH84971.1 oxidoreductase [Mycobacterium sp. GA-0227b]KUH87429.1 oxidoreductase [Mycobacterium sp. GA-1999]